MFRLPLREGVRPHFWVDATTSLYNLFGFEWTLLRLGQTPPTGDSLISAAAQAGIDLTVVENCAAELEALYEAPLALIRPDQVVAWRGKDDAAAAYVIETVLGHRVAGLQKVAS